jgi:hypothetical protein
MTQTVVTDKNNIRKYLVTEAVDIKELPQEKLGNDLELLKKQETKTQIKTDISRSTKNLNLSRIMKALQLNNPFKGY